MIIIFGCCLYPVAPLIEKRHLIESHELLISENLDSVIPVVAFGHPIWRSLKVSGDGLLEFNWPENAQLRTQDLPVAYHDAGQFYWFKVSSFLKHEKLFMERTGTIVLNDLEVQDIDNETDLLMLGAPRGTTANVFGDDTIEQLAEAITKETAVPVEIVRPD